MSEHYEFIKAFVNEGSLRWEYRLNGSHVTGRETHDQDVSDWTDKDIILLTRGWLCVERDDPVKVEVIYQ